MTFPFALSCSIERMAVLIGTAKPRPSLPPPEEAICSLMPMTLPDVSMSGPPELPWLMAASVWMPLGIVWPFGACRLLPVADTMPEVMEKS